MTTNCRLREELEQARAEIAELKAAQRPRPRDLLGLYKQPIRVPFTDEQIERMAKAAHKEFGNPDWEVSVFKDAWINAIRAALAAGGLEPCPVPEIDPADVALSTRLKRATSRDLREIAIHAYLSNDQAKRENAGCMVDPMGDAAEAIRKALSDDNGLVEHIQGELKALSERLARVSAKSGRRRTAIKQLQKAHDGWRKLAFKYDEHIKHLQQQSENRSENYKTLLEQRNHFRDELKAAITERDALKAESLTPSADEVEKLARVLCDAYSDSNNSRTKFDDWPSGAQDGFRAEARAAIAHLRPTQGHVLRDRLVDARRKVENQRVELERLNAENADLRAQLDALHPGETIEGILCERDHYRIQLDREQEWVKQYKADRDDAVAELAAVKQERDTFESAATKALNERDARPTWEHVESVKAELAALREPVGWELDVTPGERLQTEGGHTWLTKELIDLLNSRIRPVYECKECADSLKGRSRILDAWNEHCRLTGDSLERTRAALEGE